MLDRNQTIHFSTGALLMPKLAYSFFQEPTIALAKRLLGCELVHQIGSKILSGIIVETEAYLWKEDPASHAAIGETKRNLAMFGPAGCLYIYSIHNRYCLNITSESSGRGAAVLIRGIEPTRGIETMSTLRPVLFLRELTRGPGNLCQAFGIDLNLNGESLFKSERIWLESSPGIPDLPIRTTTRIGISQAKDLQLRFFVDGSPFVSGRASDHSLKRDRFLGTTLEKVSTR